MDAETWDVEVWQLAVQACRDAEAALVQGRPAAQVLQRLALALEEQGIAEWADGPEVCRAAEQYGLHDGSVIGADGLVCARDGARLVVTHRGDGSTLTVIE